MGNDTRRIVLAMFVAMAVLIGYQFIVAKVLPPPPPSRTASQPAAESAPAAAPPASPAATPTPGSCPTTGTAATAPERTYSLTAGEDVEPIPFGGQAGDALQMELESTRRHAGDARFLCQEQEG